MINRIVSFGCSHASGSEIEGPHVGWSEKNMELNFGNLVAAHYGKTVVMSARAGGSNRQILLNVIEHVQPGDVCLLSWTYFDRDNYFATSNSDTIHSDVFNSYHTLKVLALQEKHSKFTDVYNYFFGKAEHLNNVHQFTDKYTDETVISISDSYERYYATRVYRAMDFLQTFHAVNAVIKSRSAIPVNFHYDCDEDVLHLINKFSEWPTEKLFKNDFYHDFGTPEYTVQLPYGSDIALFNDYINCEDFIRFERVELFSENNISIPTSFKKWVCQKQYGDPHIWPGGRLGHLGPDEHRILADMIITHLEEKLPWQ